MAKQCFCSDCGAGRNGATTSVARPKSSTQRTVPRNQLNLHGALTTVEQLEKYAQLREKNLINDQEYAEAKARLLEPNALFQEEYFDNGRQRTYWGGELRDSWVYAILAFLIPIAGLVLWVKWNDERPLDAKWAGIGAAIGVVAYLIATPVIVTNVFYW